MRKLVVSVLTSLDGFFEGSGNDLSVLPFEDAFNTHNLQLLQAASTIVYGSTWFANNWQHWSAVAADASQSERDRAIAGLGLSLESLVISNSLSVAPDDPWAPTTRVVSRAEAPAEIARLKKRKGGDLVMFGSSTTWSPLLQRGLVDELIVLIGPAVLGNGISVYRGERRGLALISADVLPDSQLVRLRYAAANPDTRPKTTEGA